MTFYNHKSIEKNGNIIGLKIIPSRQEQMLTNQTFMRWICSLTHLELVFT